MKKPLLMQWLFIYLCKIKGETIYLVMGGIGLLALGLSMLGLGAVRLRKE